MKQRGRPRVAEQAEKKGEVDYRALSEFRYHMRLYLRHMETQCRKRDINPQQYLLMLAIKGMPEGEEATIAFIAGRLQLNHNSTVELADRCEQCGLIRRMPSKVDRRRVCLKLTAKGDRTLRTLGDAARQEMRVLGPGLIQSVSALVNGNGAVHK